MVEQDQKLKNIYLVTLVIYLATLAYGFYHNAQVNDTNALGMVVVAAATVWIVPLIFKLLHYRPVYEIYICNVIFVYFASLIGSCFHGYSIAYFDKVVHFFSGLIFAIVSAIVFMIIKKCATITNKEDYHLFLLFINALNLAIAVCWEFYEYAMLIFFDNDCINHYTQGVHDSITDMLCAFCGGIIITCLFIRAHKRNQSTFITNLCEKFYRLNIAKTR